MDQIHSRHSRLREEISNMTALPFSFTFTSVGLVWHEAARAELNLRIGLNL